MSTPCSVHTLITDVILLAEGQVLLIKYKQAEKYDNQTGWFLPNDSLSDFEHPQDCARRVLKKQLGLTHIELHLSHIESFKGNDGSWHLAFHYKAELDKKPSITPSDKIQVTEWFPVDQLPDRSEVAHHGWARVIVKAALKQG
jgi:ADP-ribose pyrophosphatase YjhB (NUDIX family)